MVRNSGAAVVEEERAPARRAGASIGQRSGPARPCPSTGSVSTFRQCRGGREGAGKHVIVVRIGENDAPHLGRRDDAHHIAIARHQLIRRPAAIRHGPRKLASRNHIGKLRQQAGTGVKHNIGTPADLREQTVLCAFPEQPEGNSFATVRPGAVGSIMFGGAERYLCVTMCLLGAAASPHKRAYGK